ncbi:MAG: sugar phosphate nucleotidyltransferase, partial [Candidatus Omnitrophica bacterium]|nr:sugar phosphate nucleotidyltransferase [Candidatus Omnitrophota bacterium]
MVSENIAGFILAAGEGRRLRPVIGSTAKALAPVCGVSLLELACSYLSQFHLKKVVVNTCYQKTRVASAARRIAQRYHLDIRILKEEQLLGTGGSLREGSFLVSEAEHFLVHNVDVLIDWDLSCLIRKHLEEKADATILLVPAIGPLTVELGREEQIVNFTLPVNQGRYTFSGVHIFRRKVLDFLPKKIPCSIVTA